MEEQTASNYEMKGSGRVCGRKSRLEPESHTFVRNSNRVCGPQSSRNELFDSSEAFEKFKSTFETDPARFESLIPRCEKPLEALQMAKLACDFATQAHEDDWTYISSCFVTGLKRKEAYRTYYVQFKEFYTDLCE